VIGNTDFGICSVWDQSEADSQTIDWPRRTAAALDAHAIDHYANEIDAAADTDLLKKSFSDAAWKRLRAIRAT
jgi:hypothetical protein